MLTADQIMNRTKTVTRRLGWRALKPGDTIAACRKCMGLRKGEKIERLAVLRVVSALREPLDRILIHGQSECIAEGFPDMTPAEFVAFFCGTHKGCPPWGMVTRIAFEYCEAQL